MTTISQSRAAILGCRQAGLPVMVTLNVEEDGETCMGSDLVSALIVCQNLGAAAFGLSCCDRPEKLYHHIEEIAPYAKIPLIVRPRAGEDFDRMLSPEEMASRYADCFPAERPWWVDAATPLRNISRKSDR